MPAMLLLWAVVTSFCTAAAPKEKALGLSKGKVVLFVIDRISWGDLDDAFAAGTLPTLKRLTQEGGVAAMNAQSWGGPSSVKSAVTISAGMKAFADERAAAVLNWNEPFESGNAGQAYHRKTGCGRPRGDWPPIVCPVWAWLQAQNEQKAGKKIFPGLLGASLQHGESILTAAFGCSDLSLDYKHPPFAFYRHPALIALNGLGYTQNGNVSKEMLLRNPTAPFGVSTDTIKLINEVRREWRKVGMMVIDFGDTFRADLYSEELTEKRAAIIRRRALERADWFLKDLLTKPFNPKRDLLIIFSLAPPQLEKRHLCPIIAYGKGIKPRSLLTSHTTKREGVVALIDIAPTILAFFNRQPLAPMVGRPITAVPARKGQDTVKRCLSISEVALVTDEWLRPVGIAILCTLQALAFSIAALWFLLPRRLPRKMEVCLIVLLRYSLSLPLSYFLLSLLTAKLPHWSLVLLLALLANFILSKSFLIVCGLTFGLPFSDLLRGGWMNFNTLLGYSPYFGVRYYGLGNITMSMLIASGLILAAMGYRQIESHWRRLISLTVAFVGTLLIVGHPALGINIGGVLAALVTYAAAFYALLGVRLRAWHIGLALISCLLLIGGFAIYDLRGRTEASHLGRFFGSVKEEGWQALWWMLVLKASAWWRALKNGWWDAAAMASLILAAVAWWKKGSELKAIFQQDPSLKILAYGTFWGALAAFFFNDTGAQPPATFFLYGWSALLLLLWRRLVEAKGLASW